MSLISCKRCGAKVSDEFSYCTNCNAPIIRSQKRSERNEKEEKSPAPDYEEQRTSKPRPRPHRGFAGWIFTPLESNRKDRGTRKGSCPNCEAEIVHGSKFCPACGRALAINVSDVLNSTFTIMRKAPLIFLPMFVELLFSSMLALWALVPYLEQMSSTATPSSILTALWNALPRLVALGAFGFLVRPLVAGMYPSMVKNAIRGKKIDMTRALEKAASKYLSILVSNVLVAILVSLGALLLVVPGLIISTWYYYTGPAIILENRGALPGMSASKSFARNKKWETFVMLLVPFGISIIGSLLRRGSPILAANGLAIFLAINLIFGLIAGVFGAVMSAYTYLSYAMRKTR